MSFYRPTTWFSSWRFDGIVYYNNKMVSLYPTCFMSCQRQAIAGWSSYRILELQSSLLLARSYSVTGSLDFFLTCSSNRRSVFGQLIVSDVIYFLGYALTVLEQSPLPTYFRLSTGIARWPRSVLGCFGWFLRMYRCSFDDRLFAQILGLGSCLCRCYQNPYYKQSVDNPLIRAAGRLFRNVSRFSDG